jgi:hypothetical protein
MQRIHFGSVGVDPVLKRPFGRIVERAQRLDVPAPSLCDYRRRRCQIAGFSHLLGTSLESRFVGLAP